MAEPTPWPKMPRTPEEWAEWDDAQRKERP